MSKQPRLLFSLFASGLLIGCSEPQLNTRDDGAIPAGAIPAAPDVRPGTQSASGGVQQSGAPAGEQGNAPAVNRSGASQTSVDAVATDTMRR